jgi:hypothetical protein
MEPLNDNSRWLIDHLIGVFVAMASLIGIMIGYVWNQNTRVIEANKLDHEKALTDHKEASDKALTEHKEMNAKMHEDTKEELTLHRQYFGKIFEAQEKMREDFTHQMSENREDGWKRHVLLIEAINNKKDK